MGRQKSTCEDDAINSSIGSRIKLRRNDLGISVRTLSEWIGMSYQQMCKYESGENAIKPKQLIRISRALDVPVSFLFEGLD